ncbi:hypothetical protein IDJ77_11380 [Mucilaginibacter sp. ZT4R22]|uniref:HTH cro/C1-type domain-containing protein n=1 Tax=Mucilaginibacter pankratovii TaxID=2772110 RepID=A0ABR7WQ10_9SPHI|nr:hypothetical protein [Mucilaginibacter pankratovii]MBD1364411.1 hypothetical protein [Mucilaginibacter pankratovii]
MSLKQAVEVILAEQKRNLTWLASEMDKTYTGFKLSLENETIKYSDINKMLDILESPVELIFEENVRRYSNKGSESNIVREPEIVYHSLRDQIEILKSTVKDKDRIIELMSKK